MDKPQPPNQKENLYRKVLEILLKNKIPFLVGGTYALSKYTGIERETHDLDLFCKAGEVLHIIGILEKAGFQTEMSDARWLAKVLGKPGSHVIDFIFGTPQGIVIVDDSWFEKIHSSELFGQKVRLVPPEEMIWSKSYRHNKFHFEGADVNHLILKTGENLDWKRILNKMEAHWELLFSTLLEFRFVYPSERHLIPGWLMEELMSRLTDQISSPLPKEKITRGPLLDIDPYKIDVEEWGFKSIT